MAEYYAVLKKAVGGLDAGSGEVRRAVYDKARNALISQLKAIDPPLAASEISRQRLELEEAIRRVERETASEARDALRQRPSESELAANIATSIATDLSSPAPAPAAEAEPEPSQLSPQDLFRQAIQKAETRGSATPNTAEPATTPMPVREAYQFGGRGQEASASGNSLAGERANDQGAEQQSGPTVRPAAPSDIPQQAQEAVPGLAPDPYLDRRDLPNESRQARTNLPLDGGGVRSDGAPRRSRLPTILLVVLIVGMIGGLGALAWSQRTIIADLLAGLEEDSTPQTETVSVAPEPPMVGPVAGPKSDDRLLESPVAGPDAIADTIASVPTPSAPAPSTPTPSTPTPSTPTPSTPTPSTNASIAKNAALYEEPISGASSAGGVVEIGAAVTWNLNESGANGAEIQASLDVPERGMTVHLVIHKNTNPDLPASHMVVATIETRGDFPGRGIGSVPRLVMKVGEDEGGQALIGATAKISGSVFWIALSAAEDDVSRNMRLLRDRSWIDLPMVYDSGQRAILTFEKGDSGRQVVEKAMAAWGAG
jgi:hypothetical protein